MLDNKRESMTMYYGIGWQHFFDEKFPIVMEFSHALYDKNKDEYDAYREGFMAAAKSVGANYVQSDE